MRFLYFVTLFLSSMLFISPVTGTSEFALIPLGWFTMGDSLDGDPRHDAPPVNIYVSEFYMARHHVTWELWQDVRNWAISHGYTDIGIGGGKGATHPVHSVSWLDAVKWCNARSEREGLTPVYRNDDGSVFKAGASAPTPNWSANGYRLPTEAEWEKAARGGLIAKRFPWGNEINHTHANYYANGSANTYDTSDYTRLTYHPTYNDRSIPFTSPVGSFPPNGYGLYDMVGNLWDWCWDWYLWSFYENDAHGPNGPHSGLHRVVRGGCWHSFSSIAKAAVRTGSGPDSGSIYVGFRLARSR